MRTLQVSVSFFSRTLPRVRVAEQQQALTAGRAARRARQAHQKRLDLEQITVSQPTSRDGQGDAIPVLISILIRLISLTLPNQ